MTVRFIFSLNPLNWKFIKKKKKSNMGKFIEHNTDMKQSLNILKRTTKPFFYNLQPDTTKPNCFWLTHDTDSCNIVQYEIWVKKHSDGRQWLLFYPYTYRQSEGGKKQFYKYLNASLRVNSPQSAVKVANLITGWYENHPY